ncbi:NAD(P)-dependent oxidoreductase [Saccharothrix coeruleofusca]|uniref:Oxidoreductase n=1 Tax=Saccharothrix coeruleofusca TaxID=33919 RepID=A0A918AWX7_9PSEU|nr:NAD(P)-binding domain-containing protein [Saccharothrix coeruleofusca]MBP2338875.1 3-hydroxyisobutyrate dehydrogenase-like beta-hydroxyacid dehydrogenase [Saccharothrix coeruleofusca]GGP86946.1 oxidoreductase [Saccharothrix coeruleofusca]
MSTATPVAVLGLGEMGRALAAALVKADVPTTVWNRTPGKADELIASGATGAASAEDAVTAAEVVVVCLFDHASVHEVLDPLAQRLRGRAVVNLTTTSPEQARELGRWAAAEGIGYLDGGIMAVPAMIGTAGSEVFYSGDEHVFQRHKEIFDHWGTSTYFGEDTGLASLYDLALLAAMYVMFAGYMQGAAMVRTAGISASAFAARAQSWLTAMTGGLAGFGAVIDGGDYTVPGQQSLAFSDLTKMLDAVAELGIGGQPLAMVQELIRKQRDAGYDEHGFARIYESIAAPR